MQPTTLCLTIALITLTILTYHLLSQLSQKNTTLTQLTTENTQLKQQIQNQHTYTIELKEAWIETTIQHETLKNDITKDLQRIQEILNNTTENKQSLHNYINNITTIYQRSPNEIQKTMQDLRKHITHNWTNT